MAKMNNSGWIWPKRCFAEIATSVSYVGVRSIRLNIVLIEDTIRLFTSGCRDMKSAQYSVRSSDSSMVDANIKIVVNRESCGDAPLMVRNIICKVAKDEATRLIVEKYYPKTFMCKGLLWPGPLNGESGHMRPSGLCGIVRVFKDRDDDVGISVPSYFCKEAMNV